MKRKIYIVHHGARDEYKVAAELSKDVRFDVHLITTGYPPKWLSRLSVFNRFRLFRKLLAREKSDLRTVNIRSNLILEIILRALGKLFGEGWYLDKMDKGIARSFFAGFQPEDCAYVLAYNYNGFRIFSDKRLAGVRKVLFMCHPHPVFCRAVLEKYMQAGVIPSLSGEKEFSYAPSYLARQIAEPTLASEIICASTLTKVSLEQYSGNAVPIKVIPYGVDRKFKYFDHGPMREEGSFSRPLNILFVGQFSFRKGINLLEKILQKVRQPVNMILVGRGMREYEVEPRAIGSGHSLEVFWDVPFKDLVSIYSRSDVFLFPTLLEGFGLVILEAMLAGVVPVTTSMSCATDVIRDGVDGFVRDPSDIDGMAESLNTLAADRVLLGRMSSSTSARAESYSWDRFGAELRSSLHVQ